MKVVLFGNAPAKNAGVRYRLVKQAERLSLDGHECRVCLPSSISLWERLWERGNYLTKAIYVVYVLVRRLLQMRYVRSADVVFFRGSLMPNAYGPPILEKMVHLLNPRMVYDIDDAVWVAPDGVESPFLHLVDFEWIWKMCRMCRHGIVGNAYLSKCVSNRTAHVTVIPTCIDPETHTAKTQRTADSAEAVLLGWVGLSSNLVYMEEIEEVLKTLSTRHNIVVMVASDDDYHLSGVKVVNHRWCLEREVDYLKEADIGLMPLFHSECARGKCAFKALQFMAVGTPCVISAVGMNLEVVQDGTSGFLADSPEKWIDSLERLITDPALRGRMGHAAREAVLARYSLDVGYAAFREVLERVSQATG